MAAAAIAAGLRRAGYDDIVELPLADGGEGTLDTLLAARGGSRRVARVTGPLGDRAQVVETPRQAVELRAQFRQLAAGGGPLAQGDPRIRANPGGDPDSFPRRTVSWVTPLASHAVCSLAPLPSRS